MANRVAAALAARDEFDDDFYTPFWYTRTGTIVKWSLFLGLFTLLALYLVLGYMHAKRRIRRGQLPLAYHRWLINRRDLARVDPRYAYPTPGYYTYRQDQYHMNAMPPPPMYDPNAPRPPVYEGPGGGSKVAPSQWPDQQHYAHPPPQQQSSGEYAAPPGPPPAAVTRGSGS